MTKKELENRLKKLEKALEPEEKVTCVTPSKYLELIAKERTGEKIDWDTVILVIFPGMKDTEKAKKALKERNEKEGVKQKA